MDDWNKYFEIATGISDKVADFLLTHFRKGAKEAYQTKAVNHYSIFEDEESDRIYRDFFIENTPEIGILSEDTKKETEKELVWVLDSIEGTSNYRAGNPFWSTQVALIYKNEPVLAIVNAPLLKQKFTAVKGKGSTLNGAKISPTKVTELAHALIDIGRGTTDEHKEWQCEILKKIIHKVRTTRQFGSTGLCLSYAASGIIDAHINNGSNLYDYAPGVLIAKESGSKVLNFEGKDWKAGDLGLIVSNDKLAPEIASLLS